MADELISNIANIGFPISISCYLLVRLEKKLEELNSSISELTKALDAMKLK